jgi:hypothetical protein
MKGQKLFYIFKDPMGSGDSKIGITGNPIVRLGVYQNSYSRKSHVACFDRVYIGPARAINNLEKAVKRELNWDIELDGRGHSEWVSMTYAEIEKKIDELISAYKFKVTKVSSQHLPMTVDNLPDFLNG